MIERTEMRDGAYYVDVDVGMPLTGVANLAEAPLLMLLGDIRWTHIQQVAGARSKKLVDAAGRRIYATFFYVEVGFSREAPMAAFGENDRFTIVNTLRLYENGMTDGYHFFYPEEWPEARKVPLPSGDDARRLRIPFVRTCNTFVRMVQGASWLKKAAPVQLPFDRPDMLPGAPETYDLILKVSQDSGFRPAPAGSSRLTPGRVVVTYEPDHDRDLNGVGLLYFANYPLILDVVERRLLTSKTALVPLGHELLDRRTVVRREIAYLANIVPADSIEISVDAWIENPFLNSAKPEPNAPISLFLNYEMRRRSDNRKMLVSTVEKVLHERTLAEAGLMESLRRLAQSTPAV